jgi:hypothetical protein
MAPRVADHAPETSSTTGKPFAEMSEAQLIEFDRDLIASLVVGDDSAAKASLAAGVPIYYAEEDTPAAGLIKEYPDGHKEMVTFSNGTESFLRKL